MVDDFIEHKEGEDVIIGGVRIINITGEELNVLDSDWTIHVIPEGEMWAVSGVGKKKDVSNIGGFTISENAFSEPVIKNGFQTITWDEFAISWAEIIDAQKYEKV